MRDKKIKIHTPKDELSEYENFAELAKKLLKVKSSNRQIKDKPEQKTLPKNEDKELR